MSHRCLAPTILAVLFLLAACAGTSNGGGKAPAATGATDAKSLAREAKALVDRRAALDKELARTTTALDGWSKRHEVGVPTPQLVLSLLSRPLDAHLGSDAHRVAEEGRSAFETEYIEIEQAMARALHERAEIQRGWSTLRPRLSPLKGSPQTRTTTQEYAFGDVFLPIPGSNTTARQACAEGSLKTGPGAELCTLVKEECTAKDPEAPSKGWIQTCTYECKPLEIGTGPL